MELICSRNYRRRLRHFSKTSNRNKNVGRGDIVGGSGLGFSWSLVFKPVCLGRQQCGVLPAQGKYWPSSAILNLAFVAFSATKQRSRGCCQPDYCGSVVNQR